MIDFRKLVNADIFGGDYIFWFFVLPFFQKKHKRKIRQKSRTKRHFYLMMVIS